MARFRYECFCTLVYDNELTYEEVLERETALETRMGEILESCGGKHVDFVSIGDSLRIQCAFVDWRPEDFRLLCAEMAELTVDGVHGRVLVVNKDLDEISVALLGADGPMLARVPLPAPAGSPGAGPGAIVLTPEVMPPLSAEERADALHRRQPGPAEEYDPGACESGSGSAGGGERRDAWSTPSQSTDAAAGSDAGACDAAALLEVWRDQMRRRRSGGGE